MRKIINILIILSLLVIGASQNSIAQSKRSPLTFAVDRELTSAFEYYKSESKEYMRDIDEADNLIRKWRQRRLSETFEQRLSSLEANLTLSNKNLIEEYNKFKKTKGADILDDSLLLRLAHLYLEGANLVFNKKMKDYNSQMNDFTTGRIKAAPEIPTPDYTNAIFYAKKILTDFDNSPLADRAHYLIGYSYDEMGMGEKAAKVYELLVTNYPHTVFVDEVSWRLAEHFFNKMEFKEAKYYYSKLAKGNSLFKVKAIYKLGATYFALGEYSNSYDAFKILVDFVDNKSAATSEDVTFYEEALAYMGALKSQGIELDMPIKFQAKIYQLLGEQYKRRSDETSMRLVYNEAIKKFPYAENIPELYSQIISSLESNGMNDKANVVRNDFTELMIKSDYWWAKNDENRHSVFRAEDLLEEHLLKNAQFLAQVGYDKKSDKDLNKAKASYERFIRNYSYSPFAETAMMELADLEYYLNNYESAANWYAKVTQISKSDVTRESAAYSYIWSKVKKVNYSPSVSRNFSVLDVAVPASLSGPEKVFEDASLFYLKYVNKGLRRQKILLKMAQIYSEKGDLAKSENALNQLIADRASMSLTSAKAIGFLESIYNIRGDWQKIKEVRELIPTLRMKTNLSEIDDLNRELQANYELNQIENLVANEKYADAIQKYKEYLTTNPRSKIKEYIYLKLSILYRNINDFNNSDVYVSRLLPTKLNKEAIFIQAKNYKSFGKFEKSAEAFEKFLRLQKNHVWYEEALQTAVNLRKGLLQWDKLFSVLNENIAKDYKSRLAPDLLEAALILGKYKYIEDYVSRSDKKDINSWLVARPYYYQALMNQKNWTRLASECDAIPKIISQVKKPSAYMKVAQSWCGYGAIKNQLVSGAFNINDVIDSLNDLKRHNISEVTSMAFSDVVLAANQKGIEDLSIRKIAEEAWTEIKDTPYHPAATKASNAYSLVYKTSPVHIGHLINWRLSLVNAIGWKVPQAKDLPWDGVRSACDSYRFDICLSGLETISKMDKSNASLMNLAIANINWGNDEKGFSYLADYFKKDQWSPEAVNYSYIYGMSDLKKSPAVYMPTQGDKFFAYVAEAEKMVMSGDYAKSVDFLQKAIQENSQNPLPYGVMARVLFQKKFYTLAAMILEEGVVNSNDTEGLFALRAHVDAALRKYGRIGYTSEALEQGYLAAVGLSLTALKNNDKNLQIKIVDILKDKKYWFDSYKLTENILTGGKNSVPPTSENAHFTWMAGLSSSDKSKVQASIKKVKNLGYLNPLSNALPYISQERDVAGENNE